MRSEEFISLLCGMAKDEEKFTAMRKDLPLGIDSVENIVYAHKKTKPYYTSFTCVTGGGKSAFIKRLLITLSCLYDKSDVCFFILSTNTEYGELLRLKSMDATVPYIRTKSDLDLSLETLAKLLRDRENGKGYPRLFVIMDGIESLEGCNRNEDLEEYRVVLDMLARKSDVELIAGVELTKSIFSGYPGAFVGIGNCLVATRETGKADVTYVNDDASLTLPEPITYPSAPSIMETVLFFNSLSKEND